ncbi:MAG: hypothetical protein KJ574_01255, partial [Nanoarchaeota archaeon]|nr:hypothetical protein [Nanoarchaeota archaeon]
IVLSILVVALFNSIIWNLMKKKHLSWKRFLHFVSIAALVCIGGGILIIITILLLNERAALMISIIEMVLFFSLFHILCSLENPNKSSFESLKDSFKHIKMHLGKYLVGMIVLFACYAVLAIIISFTTSSLPPLSVLFTYIIFLGYINWLRTYSNVLAKGASA